jgi:hypothetical protein
VPGSSETYHIERGSEALLSTRWGFSPDLPGHIFSVSEPNLCLQAVPARLTVDAREVTRVDRRPSQAPTNVSAGGVNICLVWEYD